MHKKLVLGISIMVVVIVGFMFFGGDKTQITGNTVMTGDGFVEVTTTLQGFRYNPNTITLEEGSKVRLTVDNKDNVLHAFNLKQFGIIGSIQPRSTKTVEFTATKTNGQEVYTCSQQHGETLTFIIS